MKVALLMLLAGSIASCNLDKYPDGDAIPEEQAFTTFKDAGQFRLSSTTSPVSVSRRTPSSR